MDIARKDVARGRRRRRLIYALAGLAGVVAITTGVSRLRPATPRVARSTAWVDTVKRGEMLRQVRGLGTLQPEEIRLIPAMTEGRVEKILVRPGTLVDPDTILVVLSNPQVQQEALDAEFQLKAAEAELVAVRVRRQSEYLNQKAEVARAREESSLAQVRAQTDEELHKFGVISELNLKASKGAAQQLGTRAEIEEQRLSNSARELEAQVSVQQARVAQLRALHNLARTQLNALKIRAGIRGVLQSLALNGQSLQVGQQVGAGATIATVAQPERLKAELRIAETQAKEISLGQPASIDTRNGVAPGKVVRIDPAVQNGTVTVDVALDGPLPPGARPDLSVDGTIGLERLQHVLYVGRPAFGKENGTAGIFKLEQDGSHARRVQVQLGRSSVNMIEIVNGLKEGDRVILSDMSQWDNYDRVRLE